MHKLNKPEHPAIPLLPPEIPPVPTVSEADLRRELGTVVHRDLQPILVLAGGAYLLVALRLWFRLEAPLSQPLFGSAVVAAGFALIAWGLMKLDLLGSRWSHAIGAGLVICFLANCYVQFAADPSPQISTQLMLSLIAIGYLFLFTEWYLSLTLATIALWCYVAWISQFSGLWPHFGLALVTTAVLAAWIHWSHSRTQRHLHTWRLEAAPQRSHLMRIAEQAKQHEQRFRSLWDLGFDGLFLHDKGTILDANESVCNLLGYARTELSGTHFSSYLAEESRGQFADVANFGNFQSFEAIGIRKDGNRISLHLFNKPVAWGEGKIMIVAVRDLTDRQRRENLLQEEKARSETVLRQQAALTQIELALDQPVDLDDLCRQIVEAAASLLRLSIGSCLLLAENNAQDFAVRASTIREVLPRAQIFKEIRPESALGYVIENREPLIVPTTEVASFSLEEHIPVRGIRAYAAFPVSLRVAVAGVLLVLEAEARHYNPEELAFLEILASRVGVLLTRGEIAEPLRRAARRIQEQDEEILRLRKILANTIQS